jgi:hypothetical protein
MCEAMTEPPRPGAILCCTWRDLGPVPDEGEERDLPLGDWTVRVKVTRVKDSWYAKGFKHVSMEVI